MTSRRTFLRAGALLLPPLLASNRTLAGSATRIAVKPVVVSTWDSGAIANGAAWPVLQRGGRSLDAVEAAGVAIENDVNCCVGLGGNPDRDGFVTLDACIMDEKATLVAFLEQIKHPVSVARKVMENSPHVMLVGVGAQQFALANGFTLEPATLSASAQKTYREWLKKSEYKPVINIENQKRVRPPKGHGPFAPSFFDDGTPNHDTMGTVALDASGNLSGMCTTSGMAFKLRGRLGDSPLIGAGLFIDNEVGAVTCSGQGEEVIRMAGSHTVVELMRQGLTPAEACKRAVERIVKRDPERAKTFQVGFIALSPTGQVGAYAVQPGFSYTLTNAEQNGVLIQSPSYFK